MAEEAQATRKSEKTTRGHGTPKGQGVVEGGRGGRIGNPPIVITEEMRRQVRDLAKKFPYHGQKHIAAIVGIARSTLNVHLSEELELGRAEMLAAIATQVIARALDVDARDANGNLIAKGDLDAQKFILARLGGWTTKVDINPAKGGGEAQAGLPDLSQFSDADLAEYGRLAAIAEGLDPDDVVDADEE